MWEVGNRIDGDIENMYDPSVTLWSVFVFTVSRSEQLPLPAVPKKVGGTERKNQEEK